MSMLDDCWSERDRLRDENSRLRGQVAEDYARLTAELTQKLDCLREMAATCGRQEARIAELEREGEHNRLIVEGLHRFQTQAEEAKKSKNRILYLTYR
jgi:hypothetical protein